MNRPGQRIAVVGAGISGLGAALALAERHDVTVYEAESRPGGHSNTVEVTAGGRTVPVDTGFIVYNLDTYPNLIALFDHLGVPTRASDMSFAVSADRGALEYSGSDLNGLFAQRSNLVRPRFLGMVRDILRFYREAPAVLLQPERRQSLGQYLADGRYGRAFVDDHLLPMAAAIWSCPTSAMLEFPIVSFVRFCQNHGLLRVRDRPQWRTVAGGSREYVRRLTARLAGRIRLATPVDGIIRLQNAVVVRDRGGHEERFDQVVLAVHGDQTLAMLPDADPHERAILGAFRYAANRAVLHGDPRLMPRRRSVWSSWNYLATRDDAGARAVSVTYWMNRLQGLDPAVPLFVSLNPPEPPAPSQVHAAFDYMHPVFDQAAIDAQAALPRIQGRRRTWFCGAWCGHGFHEDGLSAGLAVAASLGAAPAWRPRPTAAAA
ncbi:NAD(P)/FAD-dependent oxidoreductase [Stella sp.]|uniref:NAD(P)/FAD-dependent oxidoreductase n=1 Tax=Stella sp. TaxID=2912054 RepID=UPI0035B23E4A